MPTVSIDGSYRDRLLDSDGHTLFDSGWKKNLVVLPARVLLAALVKNESTALGIRALQVGRGDPAWDNPDTQPVPAPDPNAIVKLTDGAPLVVQLANLTIQYLDAADAVVATPTNRIEIVATLGPGQPPFAMREFGLFGQLNSVPQMIDYIRHPVMQKSAASTLERKVRLVF